MAGGSKSYLQLEDTVHHDVPSDLALIPFIFGPLSVVPLVEENAPKGALFAPTGEKHDIVWDCGKVAEEMPGWTMRK